MGGENDGASVVYDAEAIRTDFVEKYGKIVLDQIERDFLGGDKPDGDKVVQELVRLKMIGVWRDGAHLHIANSLFFPEDDELAPADSKFSAWQEYFRTRLNLKSNGGKLSDAQYCLFGTMNSVFEDLTLHGKESQNATFFLENSIKSKGRTEP